MIERVEDLLRLGWTVRRKSLESFLLPMATGGDGVIVCTDGSLVSLFELEGSRSMVGSEELDRFVDVLHRRLNSTLLTGGHALHVVFERAVEEGKDAVRRLARGPRGSAQGLGLKLGDVFDERESRIGEVAVSECLVVAVWSRVSALSGEQAKRDAKAMRRRLKAWLPKRDQSQCPLAVFETLVPRHDAWVEAVESVLGDLGLVVQRLDDEAAVRFMRRFVSGAETTSDDWRPVLAANDAPARVTEPPELGAFPFSLAPQILVGEVEGNGSGLRVGSRLYGALDMTLGPRKSRPFSELLEQIARAGVNVRFSALVEGGGLQGLGPAMARVASAFLAFSSADSAAVRNAMRELHEVHASAQAVVRLRVGVLTWVRPEEGREALQRQLSRLQQVVEGWGECVFTPLVGDVLESYAASVPGFCCGGTAEAAAAPLREVLRLLPLGRPAPIAREAVDHVFRAQDGKLLPFSFQEGEDYGFELIYGIPGRGKSVLMNSLGFGFCLQGGLERLPFSAVIDIGPSSSGLISLLREALPEERREEAGWFRLSMDAARHAINPCDTQLGCREPLAAEREFIANLLRLVATPTGVQGVPDGLRELIDPAITVVYQMRSDESADGEPNLYTSGRDEVVDGVLERIGVSPQSRATWWEIVDVLFDAGEPGAAERAQRYAVPVLRDFVSAARHERVQGLIRHTQFGTGGETVTDAFMRLVTAALEAWPIMAHPTAFDIGRARVAAVDLGDVAPHGSEEGDRQTAAVYMLARHALTRHWWIGEEAVARIPERYRQWHVERLREIRETPKRLAFDEFHRTGGAAAVRAQVERDVREARKLRVQLCLASQRIEDFGEALTELANRYWVLGAGGKDREIEALSSLFSLSATLKDAVRFQLTGPGEYGAPALLISSDQRGRFEQVVVNGPGPVELWALTTSPRDVALRERLYDSLAPAHARRVLARHFPSGSARERIARELRAAGAGGEGVSERAILDRMAAEIVAKEAA